MDVLDSTQSGGSWLWSKGDKWQISVIGDRGAGYSLKVLYGANIALKGYKWVEMAISDVSRE